MLHMYTSKEKSAENIIVAIESTVKWYRNNGIIIKILRTDNEQVNMSNAVEEFLSKPENNIKLQSSKPYQHWQNALERDVQTLENGVSTLLASQPW